MHKAVARHGDKTSTGGFVLAYSSTIFDDGKHVALSGDEATCGNCKGGWKIHGSADDMSEGGRALVVEGDPVLCPCRENRIVRGVNPGMWNWDASVSNVVPFVVESTFDSTSLARHWISFTLRDCVSCMGLSCVAHFADGTTERGIIDANSRVRFTRFNQHACSRIELSIAKADEPSLSIAQSLLLKLGK